MNLDIQKLNNLSDRLNYALQLTGTKKADLARAISVKPQVIQFLCNSNTQSSRFTFEIATVLGLNTRWLATGEGATFIADDPKNQFLSIYKRIPLLSIENLRAIFLHNIPFKEESVNAWLPLKTEEKNAFSIEMTDSSMEPMFPSNSYIFLKNYSKENLLGHTYVLAYLTKFDTFVIREMVEIESERILKPKNLDLFKEFKVTDEVNLLGIVTDCFWHIRS